MIIRHFSFSKNSIFFQSFLQVIKRPQKSQSLAPQTRSLWHRDVCMSCKRVNRSSPMSLKDCFWTQALSFPVFKWRPHLWVKLSPCWSSYYLLLSLQPWKEEIMYVWRPKWTCFLMYVRSIISIDVCLVQETCVIYSLKWMCGLCCQKPWKLIL